MRPRPWLDRNELIDLLAASEDEGGYAYALVCLLGLNGLRVSEACNADVAELAGARYQATRRVLGKGDKPAESADTRGDRPSWADAPTAAVAQPLGQPRATPQRRRHYQPTCVHGRHHTSSDAARTAQVYITIGCSNGVPLRGHATGRHTRADTTVAHDQSDLSYHRDPTFVLMAATAR